VRWYALRSWLPPLIVGTGTAAQLSTVISHVQAYPQTLSGWMKEYPGSSEHTRTIQGAIQVGPEDLERGRAGVWISHHVDFGLKHAPCEALFSMTLIMLILVLMSTVMWWKNSVLLCKCFCMHSYLNVKFVIHK